MSEAVDREASAFYVTALEALVAARIPFLVGGAFALERYTGIARHTRDLDVFVRPGDCERALGVLTDAGYTTELPFPHWLGKAWSGDKTVDIIFSSGNGFAAVDDEWFRHSVEETILGVRVRLCPPEETMWSKAFIMERERYDGADVAHVLRACAATLDWPRLIRRFGPHWHVLLSHLVLFAFVYPSERHLVPDWVVRELSGRFVQEMGLPPSPARVCRGTLLSRAQYLVDIERWGYRDARLEAPATMTPEQVDTWTAAIEDGARPWAAGRPPGEEASGADRGPR